jgi:NADH-quinone oxidoreductase subunit J
MTPAIVTFWVIAIVSVATALGVVLHRNPIRSALLLVVNFFCLAVFYVMLNAQVLAVLQVLVYAGAIMVLFLFVIMLLNLGGEVNSTDPLVGQKAVGLLLGAALLGGLVFAINRSAGLGPVVADSRVAELQGKGISQIQIIGWDLFTKYVYPFELTSVLLLVGVMGVIILTKRRAAMVVQTDGS